MPTQADPEERTGFFGSTQSRPRVETIPGPISEGSVFCLFDIVDPTDSVTMDMLVHELRRLAGHDKVLVIVSNGGEVNRVLGPDEAVALIKAKLAES